MNIAADNWALLWSGVFGAVIGAVLAAGVALLVVWRTNKHQAKLAKKQLKRQKIGLERQLLELRNEARLERRIGAASDLIAAVESLSMCYFQGRREVTEKTDAAVAAIFRWKINSHVEELTEKIHLAVSAMGVVALDLAQQVTDKDVDRAVAQNLVTCKMRFNDAMSSLPMKNDKDPVCEEQSEMELIHLSLTGKIGFLGYKGTPAENERSSYSKEP